MYWALVNTYEPSAAFGRSQNIKLRKTLNVAKKEGPNILPRLFACFVVKKNDAQKDKKMTDCITD